MAEKSNVRFMTNSQREDAIRSRPMHIQSRGRFPLKMPNQEFAVVLLGNRDLNTPCEQPAYRVVAICATAEEAAEKLEATDSQGIVTPTHSPFVIIENNTTTTEQCQDIIAKHCAEEKAHVEEDNRIMEQRKTYTKQNTTPSMYAEWEKKKRGELPEDKKDDEEEELVEYPEMEPITSVTNRNEKDMIMPLMGNAVVVTTVGRNSQTPVIIVHAMFEKEEQATEYIVNTLAPSTEHSYLGLVQQDTWQFPNREEKMTDAGDITYLDEGMNTFMQGHVHSRDAVPYVKSMVDEKDIIAPQPNLLEPAPVTRRGGAASVIMNSKAPMYEKKAVRHEDVDSNQEFIENMRREGRIDDKNEMIQRPRPDEAAAEV